MCSSLHSPQSCPPSLEVAQRCYKSKGQRDQVQSTKFRVRTIFPALRNDSKVRGFFYLRFCPVRASSLRLSGNHRALPWAIRGCAFSALNKGNEVLMSHRNGGKSRNAEERDEATTGFPLFPSFLRDNILDHERHDKKKSYNTILHSFTLCESISRELELSSLSLHFHSP